MVSQRSLVLLVFVNYIEVLASAAYFDNLNASSFTTALLMNASNFTSKNVTRSFKAPPGTKCAWSQRHKRVKCLAVCNLSNGERVALYLVVRCFAGSTALEGLLMSSSELATTCPAKQWQCEPQRVQGYSFVSSPSKRFESLAPYFNLSKKVLLMNKLLPCNNMLRSISAMESDTRYLTKKLSLPERYTAVGIGAMKPVFVLMWTPPCVLMKLSTHSRKNPAAYRKISDEFFVALSAFHRRLIFAGVPTVLINYADLLWQRKSLTSHLYATIPCLGHLRANHVPSIKSGDILVENKFKSQASIASYAKYHNPSSCDYSVESASCSAATLADFTAVADPLVSSALEYLLVQSKLPLKHVNATHENKNLSLY